MRLSASKTTQTNSFVTAKYLRSKASLAIRVADRPSLMSAYPAPIRTPLAIPASAPIKNPTAVIGSLRTYFARFKSAGSLQIPKPRKKYWSASNVISALLSLASPFQHNPINKKQCNLPIAERKTPYANPFNGR